MLENNQKIKMPIIAINILIKNQCFAFNCAPHLQITKNLTLEAIKGCNLHKVIFLLQEGHIAIGSNLLYSTLSGFNGTDYPPCYLFLIDFIIHNVKNTIPKIENNFIGNGTLIMKRI